MTYRSLTTLANSQKMKELLSDEEIFVVPTVIPEMSSKKGTRLFRRQGEYEQRALTHLFLSLYDISAHHRAA